MKTLFIPTNTNHVFNYNGFLYASPYSCAGFDFMQDTVNLGVACLDDTIDLVNEYLFYDPVGMSDIEYMDYMETNRDLITHELNKLNINIVMKG